MFLLNQAENVLRLTWQDEIIMDYNFPLDGHRPYWHPLRLPDSPVLTMNQPEDHIHHQGMWIAWKMVNGVNFWEQPAPDTDPIGYGRIVHQRIKDQSFDQNGASFTTENFWTDWVGIKHLSETRRTFVHPPNPNNLVIDISFDFQSNSQDVTFDLKRGKPGSGGLFYSGLTIRFDNILTPGKILDANGRTDTDKIFGNQSRWCGLTGVHLEDNQVYGATIIDASSNLRHPTTWWVRNTKNYGLLHPSPTYYESI
ncbi:MAG: PmoA family protein, partial [Candidatus Poribacteria bacterium]|nr:PmoA family protein [Candidatus Poribacteria bacterium]